MASDLKKGGKARFVVTNVADGESVVIPKGFRVTAVITQKVGTTAGNMALGTAVGGQQIVATVALGTVDGAIATQTLVAQGPFSMTADTPLYFTKSVAGATYNAFVLFEKVN